MSVAALVLGGALCAAGVLVVLAAALGLLRFPDFYTRLHAAALMAALGAPLTLAGLAIAAWDWRVALKLGVLGVLMAVLGPAIAHILASAAHGAGLAPIAGRPERNT